MPHHDPATSEADLVARAASGDSRAFEALYQRHVRQVYAQLFRITGPGRHLEDLLQQTFLEVHRSLPSFRGDSRFSTWLVRIAINVAAQYLRTRTRKPPPELGLDEALVADHPVELDTVALAHAWRILGELPDELRVVLVLREVQEMTLEEIAEVTSAPVSTVASRIARARGLVARALKRGKP